MNADTKWPTLASPCTAALMLAFAGATLSSPGAAQEWKPTRHVEIVAPSGAGGGSDTIARLVQRILQENRLLDVTTSVVNKPGAGGAIAWTGLNQHAGDGHHLAISTANLLEGKIRMLAVSAPQRLGGALTEVPTWRELGADVVIDNLRGVVGPKAMSAPQVAYWEGALRKMTETGDWQQRLEKNLWVNSFAGAEGSRKALALQYDQMRLGLAELGLAKN